ncbi:MAG TPA: lysophospholipid acyltransferase family protein [Solirubrobacteraceae bacterium]|nr:lysophospholipid acyltransferase family protein [Solirubrobacteraceae bacterium]
MPDVELKPQVYTDQRPKEYFDAFHARARAGEAGWTYEPTRFVVTPYLLLFFRARGIASENVPNGPVILAPNHGSFMDHFFTGAFIRRRVRFMAKSQLFQPGLSSYIFSHGGVFPVRRGHHDEDAFTTAFQILARGEAIVMYPEGGRSRTGDLAPEAKPGLGRLALESGAPVVPVAILGSHQVRNWKKLKFPRVTVQYGTPVRFEQVEHSTREQQQAVADYVLDRVREMHSQLRELGHRGAQAAASDRRVEDRAAEDQRFAMLEREQQEAKKRQQEEVEARQQREAEAEGEDEDEDGEGQDEGEEQREPQEAAPEA